MYPPGEMDGLETLRIRNETRDKTHAAALPALNHIWRQHSKQNKHIFCLCRKIIHFRLALDFLPFFLPFFYIKRHLLFHMKGVSGYLNESYIMTFLLRENVTSHQSMLGTNKHTLNQILNFSVAKVKQNIEFYKQPLWPFLIRYIHLHLISLDSLTLNEVKQLRRGEQMWLFLSFSFRR